jgi:hypothetical protein
MLNARDFEDAKKWNTLHKLYNDPRLKLSDRRVGLYLLLPADSAGAAGVSIAYLAAQTEQDQKSVERSIRKLEALGYFTAFILPATAGTVGATVH